VARRIYNELGDLVSTDDTEGGPGPNREKTYTFVITLGAQIKADITNVLGLELNAVNFDVIGFRDSEFVFMEGKKQNVAVSFFPVEAKAERTFSEKEIGDGKVERTTTVTAGGSIGKRSHSYEKVTVSDVDYLTGQTTTKKVTVNNVFKETFGVTVSAIIGFEMSRDVTIRTPIQINKQRKKIE
jgi:hypothetical protein